MNVNCVGMKKIIYFSIVTTTMSSSNFMVTLTTQINYTCLNGADNFGYTPLLEAVKFGHDRIAKILVENGAILSLEQAGNYLCKVVTESKLEMLRRLLEFGVDPNSKNYDLRTPLHVAAAEGLHLVARLLIESGADVISKDRCSITLSICNKKKSLPSWKQSSEIN
jgi:ankyrin repeat protein